jgi:hypothetical protein
VNRNRPRPSFSSSSIQDHDVEDEGRERGGDNAPVKDQPIFDHEKLDVYQVELPFVAWATAL